MARQVQVLPREGPMNKKDSHSRELAVSHRQSALAGWLEVVDIVHTLSIEEPWAFLNADRLDRLLCNT